MLDKLLLHKLLLVLLLIALGSCASTQPKEPPATHRALTADWLKKQLNRDHPRLIMQESHLQKASQLISADSTAKAYYHYLLQQGEALLNQPVLERKQIGRRLLQVSREALRRLSLLSLLYQIEKDQRFADRLNAEVVAVCQFSDWNPAHFLDVAEMALAVSLAIDWAGEALPPESLTLAKQALLEKALLPSQDDRYNAWLRRDNNWNQVCNTGISAAALVLADDQPELAAQLLQRSIHSLPIAMEVYAPDGAYPEGAGYWVYGTAYTATLISMFQTALQTDFELSASPGFEASARYVLMMMTPGNRTYNYGDSNKKGLDLAPQEILLWFTRQWEEYQYFSERAFNRKIPQKINPTTHYSRYSPIAFLWLLDVLVDKKESEFPLPRFWTGQGTNPVAVIRSPGVETPSYYLGIKGGSASVNHGNMDAGSFIYERDEIMWAIDPGNQAYHPLETIMGEKLWDRSQESQRWTLLTKNNFGHSTLTVNDSPHLVKGYAPLQADVDSIGVHYIHVDLTPVLANGLKHAARTFSVFPDGYFTIEDHWEATPQTQSLSWNWVTQAEVALQGNKAVLTQGGKQLRLQIKEPSEAQFTIVSLSPPPLPYDKPIPGLKRIEIKLEIAPADQPIGKIAVQVGG